jgi:hypothetical protein
MDHNNHNRTMLIGMGVAAAVILTISLFAGWGTLALFFLICPLMMFGMMLFMGRSMDHGSNSKHNHTK